MTFELPQNLVGWIPFLVPGLTFLLGLCYFLMPRAMLSTIGLEGTETHPEGIGDGRSTFAGFAIGLSVICILFQQPILDQMLTMAWILTAVGKLIHFLVDGGFRERVLKNLARLLIAAAIAGWSFMQTGLSADILQPGFTMPVGLSEQLPFFSAAITVLFGLIALFTPAIALKMIRMKPVEGTPSAVGEPRGSMAGFYLAVGAMALLNPEVSSVPGVFVGIALGFSWLATGFGRMIAMLSDRCNNLFNWLSLLMELVLAALPLAIIFNLIAV